MSMVFLGRDVGWRRAVERKRWVERENQEVESRGVEGVSEKEEKSGGEGLNCGGWREEMRSEAVRVRLDLNLRASAVAIGVW